MLGQQFKHKVIEKNKRQCCTCHNFVILPEIYCNICKTKHERWEKENGSKKEQGLCITRDLVTDSVT
jgi:hypothetical protein